MGLRAMNEMGPRVPLGPLGALVGGAPPGELSPWFVAGLMVVRCTVGAIGWQGALAELFLLRPTGLEGVRESMMRLGPYVRLIPRHHHGVRLFGLLPLLFAVRTLALGRDNPDVLQRETRITRGEVLAIARNARVMGFSNRWIDWYCRRMKTVGRQVLRGDSECLARRGYPAGSPLTLATKTATVKVLLRGGAVW